MPNAEPTEADAWAKCPSVGASELAILTLAPEDGAEQGCRIFKTPASILASNRASRATNKDKYKATHIAWVKANKDKVYALHKRYRIEKKVGYKFSDDASYQAYLNEVDAAKTIRRAGAKEREKQTFIKKHGGRAFYEASLRQRNPQRLLRSRLGARLQRLVLDGYMNAKPSTFSLIGCTGHELRVYIESLFLTGMSWENRRLWHIDHIRPCNTFDLTDPAQQAICFHHTNLRPLWAIQNLTRPRDGSDIPALMVV